MKLKVFLGTAVVCSLYLLASCNNKPNTQAEPQEQRSRSYDLLRFLFARLDGVMWHDE